MKKTLLILLLMLPVLPSAFAEGGCARVVVGNDEKGSPAFSATQILDVEFSVAFVRGAVNRFSKGDHEVEIRISTPGGHHYQSFVIPFTSDEKLEGRMRRVARYPDPIAIQQLKEKGNLLEVRGKLPVAGTLIVTNSLYGTWTIEAFVDGEPVRCAPAVQFTINQ